MFYSVIYKCNRRVFPIEVNFGGHAADLNDDYINDYLLNQIEKFKDDSELSDKKQTIIKVEFSIDREAWFLLDRCLSKSKR